MTVQNLVSATLPENDRLEILQKLSQVRDLLPFLITLNDKQMLRIRKASRGYQPFVQIAHDTAVRNPEILPPVFALEEYHKDWELAQALTPILQSAEELVSALRHTLIATNSDVMVESLEVYNAVKLHKNKVPGLDVIHEDLSTFFKKSKPKPAASEASPSD